MVSSVLAAALNGVHESVLDSREQWALKKLALTTFLQAGGDMCNGGSPPPETSQHESAIDGLDRLYSLLSKIGGVPIKRPTAAVALLQAMELDPGFIKRMSRLTSRRHHQAHPDQSCVDDIIGAVQKLDPAFAKARAAIFVITV